MDIFTIVSAIFLSLALLSAIIIVFNLFSHPQPMKVMNVVWPLTALWSSVLGLAAYFSFGKKTMKMDDGMDMDPDMKMDKNMDMHMDMSMDMGAGSGMQMDMKQDKFWQKVALSTFHCGAGCTLADIIGESLGYRILSAFGLYGIGWSWTLDYILALLIGAGFQYAAIRPMMQKASPGSVFSKALKIDFLSLTSWQIGMYGLSYIVFFIILPEPLSHNTFGFWFIMQLAMCAGFLLSFPMNWFLIKKGIKPSM